MGLSFPICPAQLSHPCFYSVQSGQHPGPHLKALVDLNGVEVGDGPSTP